MSREADIEILIALWDDNPSIPEIAEKVDKSLAYVHGRLREFEREGLVRAPRYKNAARDRTLTDLGKDYLLENGYVSPQVFEG